MSTTTETDPLAPPRPAETAPSAVLADPLAFARLVGFVGLFGLILGLVVVIANEAVGQRWIGKGGGYLFAAVGVALMLYHAARDAEQDVRRMYGALAALWLVLAVGAAVAPGPLFGSGTAKAVGYHLVPFGVGFAFLALLFAVPFVRHETDPTYRGVAVNALLVVGVVLAAVGLVGPVLGTLVPALGRGGLVFRGEFLAGPGIALAVLGLGYLCAYLGQVDSGEGRGYQVAVGIGVLGAAVALFAFARAAVPELLLDGPNALRNPAGDLDGWKVAARAASVAVFAGLVWAAVAARRAPLGVRSGLAAVGVAGVAVLLVASFKANTLTVPPPAFLVPAGVILMGLGLVYLGVAVGVCSDNQFVTLTRRELSGYFLSPIGYLVLAGTTLMQWISYWVFTSQLMAQGQRGVPIREPIVADYLVALFPVLTLLLQVPALTMRLLAEEKRSGSLEVLLTAPVNEAPVVLSKFVATWLFFMISWLPTGLFLLALPGTFDYRPLLSFYIAFGAQGLAFIAVGLFFSALTRDQLVAAVLTFVVMLLFLVCYIIREFTNFALPEFWQGVVNRLSFVSMWIEALEGRLPLRDTLLYASLGLFFLFLSVKVLETRKWN
ncbi:MAG: ABC transporter permease [Gemmataceae bacterium]|nr:ABC transporter permease [Gemmataceae bacterium]